MRHFPNEKANQKENQSPFSCRVHTRSCRNAAAMMVAASFAESNIALPGLTRCRTFDVMSFGIIRFSVSKKANALSA
jgi:hypothetical protein